ncbi:MAG: ubiquinol-cytochrome C reductase, partial [Pseudolysinimonas sp.]
MANDQKSDNPNFGTTVEKYGDNPPAAGTAVVASNDIPNPGFPPFRPRVADIFPAKERENERRVSALFVISIIGSVLAIVAYIVFPIVPGDVGSVRNN